MKRDIDELKRLLPLDSLMTKLGHGDLVKRSARCPFHEDKTNSFSAVQLNGNGWHWHCFAGCGAGDEIDFIQKFYDLNDIKSAITRYLELVGNDPLYIEATRRVQGKVRPAKVVVEPKPFKPAILEPLEPSAVIKIAEWRGLEPMFVQEMSDKGIIGLYDGKPAFKCEGGVQYRIPNAGWRYSAGAKASALVLGDPNKCFAHVVESNWDALALLQHSQEQQGVLTQVICTRGAANARLAIDYIDKLSGGSSMQVTIIPHNDDAGEKWLQDLRAGLMLHQVTVKRVPKQFKDFNEYYANKKKDES